MNSIYPIPCSIFTGPDFIFTGVSQSVDLGQSNNPNTTPTKDYKIV